ncbi:MAG: trypsin-like peptidase domain-containing protein [Desulfobacteraceae bacterium]|nr:trypsin-like peptidase domain-containing protein [Desulfobacteraceae bacterium]
MNRILLFIFLMVCLSVPSAQSETKTGKAIYGNDNRLDEYQVTSAEDLSLGVSTIILVHRNNITDNSVSDPSNRTYTLDNDRFGNNLRAGESQACTGEPFRNQPNPGYCSGFLVGPDIILTAGHCVLPDISCAHCNSFNTADIFVVAGYAVTNASTPDAPELTIPADHVYRISQVIQKSCNCTSDEDWAVARLNRQPPFAPLGIRRTGQVGNDDDLFVIGFPAGLPRKYAGDANVVQNSDGIYFETNLDTYGGNSGAAVFNRDTGEVEGILVRGDTDYCADTFNNCWYSCTYAQDPPSCPGIACEDVTRSHLTGILTRIPRVVFVKSGYSGLENGEKRQPFDTVNQGVSSISSNSGDALVIQPGNYQETITISTPMVIYNGEFKSGTVRIGM